jgi:uncharacterized protein
MSKNVWNNGIRPILASLVVGLVMSLSLQGSCSNWKSSYSSSGGQEMSAKPKETPITIVRTKENEGKRCEARYFFGEREDPGSNEGYTSYCYHLQLRLVEAAGDGNLAEIRETLKYGANPNLPVDNNFPPLLTAAASGKTEAARLLIDNGVDVNEDADFQNTPLNMAASNGHINTVRLLLERGADPCYPSSGGTAGDIARARGFKELAELLKAAEARICK